MLAFLDYETLRIVWWILLGVLIAGFAILDGFDFGVLNLLPWVARNDAERQAALRTIEPVWEGNQVWLILGGGAVFAAWPLLYAVSFSVLYLPMMLVLAALIVRPVALKFRSKLPDARWRSRWDTALWWVGTVPSVVLGVAVAQMITGLAYHFDADFRIYADGGFWDLFTPFTLLLGGISWGLFTLQGAAYLFMKAPESVAARNRVWLRLLPSLLLGAYAIAGIVVMGMDGWVYQPASGHLPSVPMAKTVLVIPGQWHIAYPIWLAVSVAAVLLGFLGIRWGIRAHAAAPRLVFASSSLMVLGMVATVGHGTYPFLLRSTTRAGDSLTIWDASSSEMTLLLMLVAVVVLFPIVLAYTTWMYRLLKGRVQLPTGE